MRIPRRTLLLGATTSLAFGDANASRASSAEMASLSSSVPELVDDYLTRLSGYGYAGAMLLVKDGNTLLRKGYGLANDADRIPMRYDTVSEICSCSKSFTAGAMMRLVAQGRVQLSDPIARFLGDVPDDKRDITIEQILSHTAGLDSEFPANDSSGYSESREEVTRDEAIRRILATTLIDRPGDNFHYSNPGYTLAAAIVEIATQRQFREFLRAEIFAPLSMTNTGFRGAVGLPNVPDSRLARGYEDSTETGNLRTRSSTSWADLGAGQIVSTVDDLYLWMQAMRRDSFLPTPLRDRMWTPVKGNYGLGWQIEERGPGGRRIHHGGDGGGFGCELAYYPDHDMVLAHLVNRQKDVLTMRYAADRVVPLLVLGQPPRIWPFHSFDTFDMPPRWDAGHTAQLDALVGTYRISSGSELIVTKRTPDDYQISARGQDAVDVILPATAEDRAIRARSNDRALALIRAVNGGDRAVLVDTLRPGAPVEGYQRALMSMEGGAEIGNRTSIDVIGTAPSGFPVDGRVTALKYTYERGEDYLRFTWDPVLDRILNLGGGPHSLGSVPLRVAADGEIVGWEMILGRSVRISVRGRPVRQIQLETSDGARVAAVRTA